MRGEQACRNKESVGASASLYVWKFEDTVTTLQVTVDEMRREPEFSVGVLPWGNRQ